MEPLLPPTRASANVVLPFEVGPLSMAATMARGEVETFARRLDELKEAGSTLLIVGADAAARSDVSEQLLGSPRAERRPVFVLLGRDRSVVDDRIGDDGIDPSQVIEYGFSRSMAQSEAETPPSRPRMDSLRALGSEIVEAIETVEAGADEPLEPGELRVCIDSLTAAVDGFDRGAVETFLDEVRTAVTARGGMAHAVLPLSAVPDRYDWLEDAFDAVVEARSVDGTSLERWRLADEGLRTAWFPVETVHLG